MTADAPSKVLLDFYLILSAGLVSPHLNASPPGPPVSSCVLIQTKWKQRSQIWFVTLWNVSHSEWVGAPRTLLAGVLLSSDLWGNSPEAQLCRSMTGTLCTLKQSDIITKYGLEIAALSLHFWVSPRVSSDCWLFYPHPHSPAPPFLLFFFSLLHQFPSQRLTPSSHFCIYRSTCTSWTFYLSHPPFLPSSSSRGCTPQPTSLHTAFTSSIPPCCPLTFTTTLLPCFPSLSISSFPSPSPFAPSPLAVAASQGGREIRDR